MLRTSFFVTTLACLLVWQAFPLAAQTTTGTITGTVTDSSALPMPGVTVMVRNEGTNTSHETSTDARGDYAISHLIPGTYAVSVKQSGFKSFSRINILLQTATTVRIDIPLEIGDVVTEVTVTGGAPLVESETSNISGIRTNEVMLRMPINVRGSWNGFFYDMIQLTPGVQASGSDFSLAGTRGSQNQFTLDGTSVNSPLYGSQIGPAQSSMESVRELKVDLANNKAEYNLPGLITGSTKSGENTFHGSLFYYHNNGAFNARNTFSNSVPFQIAHDVGGSIGGPVDIPKIYKGKDRTFFFFAHERFPSRSETIQTPNVPTEKMRRGDFSALLPGTVVKDPFTGQAFPDNVIPSNLLSPVSLKVQERYYPLPNHGNADSYSANYRGVGRGSAFKHVYDVRIDHNVSASNFFFGRFSYARQGEAIHNQSQLPTVGTLEQNRKAIPIVASDTHIFSPNLVNEFKYGLIWSRNPFGLRTKGADLVKEFGLEGLSSTLPQTPGMPYFNITGFTSISADNPYGDGIESIHTVADNVSWTRGEHTMKFGVLIRRNRGETYAANPNGAFGTYSFTNAFSGFAYSDFLLGIPQSSSRLNPAPKSELVNMDSALFIQDDWKVSRRLTLNLGLRYERNPPFHETGGLLFLFDPSAGRIVVPDDRALAAVNPLFPRDLAPIVTAETAGLPKRLFYGDTNNWGPRFGFAFRPFGTANTVVRGGFGVFSDNFTASMYSLSTGGPFVSSEDFTNVITNGTPAFMFPRAFPEGFGAIGAQSFSPIDPHIRNPYIEQWNLTLEREVLHMSVRVSYIGTATRRMVWSQNVNQPAPGLETFRNDMRRFPALRDVNYRVNGGSSSYNSLHTVAERRFRSGLYYQLAWTWLKSLTDVQSEGESGTRPENSYNRAAERGNVSFLATHRVIGQLVYHLPFGPGRPYLSGLRGWPRALLGGWIVTSAVTAQTGSWFTPSFSTYDVSNTNTVGGRPDRIASGKLPESERSLSRWFDSSAFRIPGDLNGDGRPDVAVGRFGNSGVNILTGPGLFVLNSGIHKEFSLGERARAVLQFTAVNAPNHVNYSNPSSNISSSGTVAKITRAGAARAGQLALRIEF